MKNLIKELCKREAGKSEVSVGNVRSILKHLADIIVDANVDVELPREFVKYCEKRGSKIMGFKVGMVVDLKNIGPLPKKKKARMKKAKGK